MIRHLDAIKARQTFRYYQESHPGSRLLQGQAAKLGAEVSTGTPSSLTVSLTLVARLVENHLKTTSQYRVESGLEATSRAGADRL